MGSSSCKHPKTKVFILRQVGSLQGISREMFCFDSFFMKLSLEED